MYVPCVIGPLGWIVIGGAAYLIYRAGKKSGKKAAEKSVEKA
jgi:threonine/homoserine/homoserine lactone efflux protein